MTRSLQYPKRFGYLIQHVFPLSFYLENKSHIRDLWVSEISIPPGIRFIAIRK